MYHNLRKMCNSCHLDFDYGNKVNRTEEFFTSDSEILSYILRCIINMIIFQFFPLSFSLSLASPLFFAILAFKSSFLPFLIQWHVLSTICIRGTVLGLWMSRWHDPVSATALPSIQGEYVDEISQYYRVTRKI